MMAPLDKCKPIRWVKLSTRGHTHIPNCHRLAPWNTRKIRQHLSARERALGLTEGDMIDRSKRKKWKPPSVEVKENWILPEVIGRK